MKAVSLILALLSTYTLTAVQAQKIPSKAEDIRPLLIGESIPKAKLQDAQGQTVSLHRLIQEKPTVLVFYRGGWCPYCNTQLAGLKSIEQDVLNLGYQIVAISPDDYRNISRRQEEDSLSYTVLSDPQGQLIKELGIAFQTPLTLKGYISSKGQKGKISEVIPVPSVLVVNRQAEIKFVYTNINYKQRMNEKMLLSVLGFIQD